MGMIKKYHNRILQTNPWHREEEPHNSCFKNKFSNSANSTGLSGSSRFIKLAGVQNRYIVNEFKHK